MTGHGNGQANTAAGSDMTATPQRNRWGRIWPWALLWGAAPMPLYIWLAVGLVV